MALVDDLLKKITEISVFALVGASGTGKSFRAKLVAQKHGIDTLIDDGLLIQNDKIIAGRSAKREKSYMGAVRVALFDNKEHRDEVAKALQSMKIQKILLLGTSDKMVNMIAERLQLPPVSKIIRIEEIATKEEIEQAIRSRQVEGKHVIPVPAIEIKKSSPKIFLNAVRVFFSRGKRKAEGKLFEKSVVRPEFSKKGRISISEAALNQMTLQCVSNFNSDIRVRKLSIKTNESGYKFILTIDVPFGTQLTSVVSDLQRHLIDNIERFTGIMIEEVNIIIDKIRKPETKK
jgi:adenylate kinase family enzyme